MENLGGSGGLELTLVVDMVRFKGGGGCGVAYTWSGWGIYHLEDVVETGLPYMWSGLRL